MVARTIRYDYSLLRDLVPGRVGAADSGSATNAFEEGIRLTKLPQITALFWVMKIAATTLGETGATFSLRP